MGVGRVLLLAELGMKVLSLLQVQRKRSQVVSYAMGAVTLVLEAFTIYYGLILSVWLFWAGQYLL